jgi:hypothetical protein
LNEILTKRGLTYPTYHSSPTSSKSPHRSSSNLHESAPGIHHRRVGLSWSCDAGDLFTSISEGESWRKLKEKDSLSGLAADDVPEGAKLPLYYPLMTPHYPALKVPRFLTQTSSTSLFTTSHEFQLHPCDRQRPRSRTSSAVWPQCISHV